MDADRPTPTDDARALDVDEDGIGTEGDAEGFEFGIATGCEDMMKCVGER